MILDTTAIKEHEAKDLALSDKTEIHLGGTVRARTATQTLEIIKPYIQKAGITRIANLTGLDCLEIPVYTCFRPQSNNLATSQGKGITDDLAMCSAYMEAIEHYYSETVSPELTTRMDEIAPAERVALSDLPPGMIHCEVKEKFIHHWTHCTSLLNDKPLFFPTDFFSFDLQKPCMENSFFRKTTTGLASGNTLVEATCHALYECIERHCQHEFQSKSFQEKIDRLIDVNTVQYTQARYLIDKLADHQVECAIFRMTNDLNIPTYHAIIADENPFRKLGHYSGTGTHLSPGIAICRALTEAVQSRLTYIAGSRDDMFPKDYKMKWRPLNLKGSNAFEAESAEANLGLDPQLKLLLERLSQFDYHPYRYEHTPTDCDISVVKVMIPGLTL